MVSINYSSREVCCKIVYYGPGLSGKTTNLLYVHSKIPSGTRGKMISLATEADRTLYFDFLPINIGTINGFAAKFQLYTVPGQVYYNATRKLVLRGVDGVVFVADSQKDKMDENIESLSNLEENLCEYGYNIQDLPMVIQYNKRDLPGILPVEELNAKLNTKGRPVFEASATIGNGVFDTLKLIIRLVLEKAKSNSSTKPESFKASSASSPVEPQTPSNTSSEPLPAPAPDISSTPNNSATVTTPETVTSNQVSNSSTMPESTGVSTTSVMSEKESTAAPVTKEPEPSSYRPYPGGKSSGMQEKKITPTTFTPTTQQELEDKGLGQKAIDSYSDSLGDSQRELIRPAMAPSIRRRNVKKRGFLKRLFGIK